MEDCPKACAKPHYANKDFYPSDSGVHLILIIKKPNYTMEIAPLWTPLPIFIFITLLISWVVDQGSNLNSKWMFIFLIKTVQYNFRIGPNLTLHFWFTLSFVPPHKILTCRLVWEPNKISRTDFPLEQDCLSNCNAMPSRFQTWSMGERNQNLWPPEHWLWI